MPNPQPKQTTGTTKNIGAKEVAEINGVQELNREFNGWTFYDDGLVQIQNTFNVFFIDYDIAQRAKEQITGMEEIQIIPCKLTICPTLNLNKQKTP